MPTLRHCESADDLHGTVKIGYEVHNGDAAASWVVFVAGVAAPRGMWDRQVAALAPTTGAVTVDNRGIGDSDVPAGGYSTEAMAADVLTVVADVVRCDHHTQTHVMRRLLVALERRRLLASHHVQI